YLHLQDHHGRADTRYRPRRRGDVGRNTPANDALGSHEQWQPEGRIMWKFLTLAALAGTFLAGGAPAFAQQATDTARADFVDGTGKETGRAQLTTGHDGVLFEVEVSGLEPRKWVALHIHETGTCDP